MIARIWHGWTAPDNADAYQRLLETEVLPGIVAMKVAGFLGVEVLRRDVGDEVEFVTFMRFESLDDIRRFAGDDPEKAYVPDAARALLAHFDERSQHYEIRHVVDAGS
jgi:antibiotic biosynthesis monooxygenase (ABM) superfamily enzyme